jgi:hypothetical protein
MTELFITAPINILEVGVDVPEVEVVETGDLRWPTTAEQWGTVMVKVEDAIVTESGAPSSNDGFMGIDDGSGQVYVDHDSDSLNTWYLTYGSPPVGTFVSSLRGWVYHHFGNYGDSTTYKLAPLYVSDMEFGAGPPVISDASRTPCTPGPSDGVEVSAEIIDNSAVASAEIMYSVDGGAYQSTAMSIEDISEDIWAGTIPATGIEGARVNYYISATDDGINQGEVETSTFPYDTDVSQFGYVSKDGDLSIEDIQFTNWSVGDSPYNGCEVTVTGIVTGDTMQFNSYYFQDTYTIQSENSPWNGVMISGWEATELTRGDEVTITGFVEEYDDAPPYGYAGQWVNNTKIVDVSAVVTNSTGNAMAAIPVGTEDLEQDADEVESYEGCLVTVSGVTVSAVNAYDWSIIDDSGVECLIDDDMANMAADNYMSDLVEGTTLASVTGIFNFSFGTYKIQIRDMADLGQLGIDDDFAGVAREFALYPNFPNPFNPETRIRFQLAENSNVKLMIYDVLGRKVRTLVSKRMDAGHHVLNWNGLNDAGADVASGMYIYRIKADDFIDHRKMLLIR